MNLAKTIIEQVYSETQGDAKELEYYRANWPMLMNYALELESSLQHTEESDPHWD